MENVKIRIADIEIKSSLISLSVEWLSLPLRYRQKLARELMGRSLEYSTDELALHIFIPVRHGIAQTDEAFMFLTDYFVSLRKKTDSEIVAELEKFAKDEPSKIAGNCKRLDPICNKLLCLYANIEAYDCSLW